MEYKSYSDPEGLKFSEDEDAWYLEGYIAKYNVDFLGDRIIPGAFTKSLERRHESRIRQGRPSRIRFLWNHEKTNPGCVIGQPLEFVQDPVGLWAKARFIKDDDFPTARQAYKLAKFGLVDQFSFGYVATKSNPPKRVPGQIRDLIEMEIFEISLTPVPINDETEITEVKSQTTEESMNEEVIAEEIPQDPPAETLEQKSDCGEVEDEAPAESPTVTYTVLDVKSLCAEIKGVVESALATALSAFEAKAQPEAAPEAPVAEEKPPEVQETKSLELETSDPALEQKGQLDTLCELRSLLSERFGK